MDQTYLISAIVVLSGCVGYLFRDNRALSQKLDHLSVVFGKFGILSSAVSNCKVKGCHLKHMDMDAPQQPQPISNHGGNQ